MLQAGTIPGVDDAEAEAEKMLREAHSLGLQLAALELANLLLKRARAAIGTAEAEAAGAEAAQLLEAAMQPWATGNDIQERASAAWYLFEACWDGLPGIPRDRKRVRDGSCSLGRSTARHCRAAAVPCSRRRLMQT